MTNVFILYFQLISLRVAVLALSLRLWFRYCLYHPLAAARRLIQDFPLRNGVQSLATTTFVPCRCKVLILTKILTFFNKTVSWILLVKVLYVLTEKYEIVLLELVSGWCWCSSSSFWRRNSFSSSRILLQLNYYKVYVFLNR